MVATENVGRRLNAAMRDDGSETFREVVKWPR